MESATPKERLATVFIVALALLFASAAQPLRGHLRTSELKFERSNQGSSLFTLSARGDTRALLTSGRFSSSSGAPTPGFVVADFTGDTHPDIATVEVNRVDSTDAHYWVEVRLSEGRSQILTLSAPFGGLAITPKDLTGDGNLDLIVRSATSHELLAVFLNDGNGHFSEARLSSFAGVLHYEAPRSEFNAPSPYCGSTPGYTESQAAAYRISVVCNLPQHTRAPLAGGTRHLQPSFLAFASNRAPPYRFS